MESYLCCKYALIVVIVFLVLEGELLADRISGDLLVINIYI